MPFPPEILERALDRGACLLCTTPGCVVVHTTPRAQAACPSKPKVSDEGDPRRP